MAKLVAFYLENKYLIDIDLSSPEFGNPGCGGTEFLFVALPYYLKKNLKEFEPILFANRVMKLPQNIKSHIATSAEDALVKAKDIGCSLFVYRPHRVPEYNLLNLIDKIKVPTIAWAHITPNSDHMRLMAKTKYVKAVVCVEHEQYDLAQDSPVLRKLTYIVNGFDCDGFQLPNCIEKDKNLVVYLGALVPQKGFHILAKAWPKIIERCPDARLKIIGTGALYGDNKKMGPWGIADEDYEEKYIIPFLSDDKGKIISSVCFLGKLGIEKKYILQKALIGIPNPSGQTENCPGSALEFQALGTAIVSGRFYGLLDTVQDKITGLLSSNEHEFVNNICYLLDNPDDAIKYGDNGMKFVSKRYNYQKVILEWESLFETILSEENIKRKKFKSNIFKHYKLLIMINRCFQLFLGAYLPWPSIEQLKIKAFRFLKGNK